MDAFSLIQHFFTRMHCHFCSASLEPDGIELLRREQEVYVVNVQCLQCDRQMGIALVGVEGVEVSVSSARQYRDPELPPEEWERLSAFSAIDYDDVIAAHRFFNQPDATWQAQLQQEMRRREIALQPESPAVPEPPAPLPCDPPGPAV